MVREPGLGLGGAPRRASGRGSAPGVGADENAPPRGASAPATTDSGAPPRPALRAIQPPAGATRRPQWLPPTTRKRDSGFAAAAAGGKAPARVGAAPASLAPTRGVRKPAWTARASSAEVPSFRVREAISLWESNNSVQNVSSVLQQDAHAPKKIEDCSADEHKRNSEEILCLQLELDIFKEILVEEIKDRSTALVEELKVAKLRISEVCRQKEATEKELSFGRSVIEALESQLILMIELQEPKKDSLQSPMFLEKRDMETLKLNSELGVCCRREYLPDEEPKMQTSKCFDSEDSPLSTKLKRMQASLEKARSLNMKYQRDQASRSSSEHEKDEVRQQVEIETAKVITSLTSELSSLQQQLDDSIKNELVAKQSLDKIHRIELLLDESMETLVQKEVLEQHYVSVLRGMEEEIPRLCLAAASLSSCNKEKEIAKERKTYAEEKKLLEMSIEDLEITVCSLESKVDMFKEEAEQQRRQQEKLEMELQNVKQQLLGVTSSRKTESSIEDGMVNLSDSIRHPSDINNELLGALERRRVGRKDVSEKESEILRPVQEGPTSTTIRHGCNMGMVLPFEELVQGTYSSILAPCSSSDVSKSHADISLPGLQAMLHITSQKRPNTNPLVEADEQGTIAIEPAPIVEQQDDLSVELEEPSSGECMQEADQSDTLMDLSDEDYQLKSSESEHASEHLEQFSSSKQPGLCGSSAYSDESLSGFESKEQMQSLAVGPVVEVLKENELPPVAPVRPNDPMNYMRAPSDELKKLRSRNHYDGQRTATDKRFWSIEQQDLYNSIYHRANFFDMKWIDWDHIDSIEQFAGVRERFTHLGLEQIMSYRCDWNNEVIRQFYSTVQISADKSSITWMTDGKRITTNKRAWEEMFGIPGGGHTEIHSQFLLDDDNKRILYTAAQCTIGQISGLSPLASIANKILRTTIYPRSGNTLHLHNWNILYHIVEQYPFDIVALIFGEIDLLISDRGRTKDKLLYAPYIMGMIMRAFEYDGPRESQHHSYRPRPDHKPKPSRKGRPPAAPTVAPPVSAAAVGHEAHVEVVDDHCQTGAAGHDTHAEAVQGQTVLIQPITRTDLFKAVEDGLRPIRHSLASMEGRIGRVEGGVTLPSHDSQRISSSTSSHGSIPAAAHLAPAASSRPFEQTSTMHTDKPGVSAQPPPGRPSPFSRFAWYQKN